MMSSFQPPKKRKLSDFHVVSEESSSSLPTSTTSDVVQQQDRLQSRVDNEDYQQKRVKLEEQQQQQQQLLQQQKAAQQAKELQCLERLEMGSRVLQHPRGSLQDREETLSVVHLWRHLILSQGHDDFETKLRDLILTYYPKDNKTLLDDVISTFLLFYPQHAEVLLRPLVTAVQGSSLTYNKKAPPFYSIFNLFSPSHEAMTSLAPISSPSSSSHENLLYMNCCQQLLRVLSDSNQNERLTPWILDCLLESSQNIKEYYASQLLERNSQQVSREGGRSLDVSSHFSLLIDEEQSKTKSNSLSQVWIPIILHFVKTQRQLGRQCLLSPFSPVFERYFQKPPPAVYTHKLVEQLLLLSSRSSLSSSSSSHSLVPTNGVKSITSPFHLSFLEELLEILLEKAPSFPNNWLLHHFIPPILHSFSLSSPSTPSPAENVLHFIFSSEPLSSLLFGPNTSTTDFLSFESRSQHLQQFKDRQKAISSLIDHINKLPKEHQNRITNLWENVWNRPQSSVNWDRLAAFLSLQSRESNGGLIDLSSPSTSTSSFAHNDIFKAMGERLLQSFTSRLQTQLSSTQVWRDVLEFLFSLPFSSNLSIFFNSFCEQGRTASGSLDCLTSLISRHLLCLTSSMSTFLPLKTTETTLLRTLRMIQDCFKGSPKCDALQKVFSSSGGLQCLLTVLRSPDPGVRAVTLDLLQSLFDSSYSSSSSSSSSPSSSSSSSFPSFPSWTLSSEHIQGVLSLILDEKKAIAEKAANYIQTLSTSIEEFASAIMPLMFGELLRLGNASSSDNDQSEQGEQITDRVLNVILMIAQQYPHWKSKLETDIEQHMFIFFSPTSPTSPSSSAANPQLVVLLQHLFYSPSASPSFLSEGQEELIEKALEGLSWNSSYNLQLRQCQLLTSRIRSFLLSTPPTSSTFSSYLVQLEKTQRLLNRHLPGIHSLSQKSNSKTIRLLATTLLQYSDELQQRTRQDRR